MGSGCKQLSMVAGTFNLSSKDRGRWISCGFKTALAKFQDSQGYRNCVRGWGEERHP